MGTPTTLAQRFRSNPVEILVFTAVCALAGYSVLRTLNYPPTASYASFAPGYDRVAPARQLASLREQGSALEVPCELRETAASAAPKVNLFGAACDIPSGKAIRLIQMRITNETNKYSAVIAAGASGLFFEAANVPLEVGHNRLVLNYSYSDGTQVARSVTYERSN